MPIGSQYVVMALCQEEPRKEHTMTLTTKSRARRIVSRISTTWAELDYAQRRMLEIQSGVGGLTAHHGRRTRTQL